MSKFKYTLGPWEASKERPLHYIWAPTLSMTSCPQYGRAYILVAKTEPVSIGSEDANAHLIAAAPELLEACQALLDAMLLDKTDEDRWEVMHIAYNAIDKAEGKS